MGELTALKVHFADFTLDQSAYRLERGERLLRLEKLPMELLILLVERHGELVAREEIAERLWGKDVFVDVDHSINTAVRKLRLALRDDPDNPRFVETVVGKGYRFAAPVSFNNGNSHPPLSPQTSVLEAAPAVAAPQLRANSLPMHMGALLATVLVLILFAAVFLFIRHGRSSVPRSAAIQSLAVLPLKNLSGDPGQEYFADGMTEAVIGRLAMIPGLRVISRTSAMQFKGTRLSAPDIARTLNVDAIVEGSVIREGGQVRVTVQMIRGKTDEHIWSEQYRREYVSLLALQDEVAQTIAERTKISLAPTARVSVKPASVPMDPEAEEDYLKGRYYFNQRTEESLDKSIAYFNQAIARNPAYALAYSGMADAYSLLGFRGRILSKEALSRAKTAALKAVELDDTLPDPHASLAFIAETQEWDWATAEREYKRALQLNPGDARAHHWYAGYLMYVGRFEQGIDQAKLARDLDPLSLPVNNALAGRLLVASRYDEAVEQVRKTLELNANFAPAHQTLGWAYLNRGKNQDAIREFQQAIQLSAADDTDFVLDLGFAYATAGKRAEALKILATLKERYRRNLVPSGSIAILYGALGDLDQAFAWLEKAYTERDPELTYLQVPGRRFEPLRHDPRFQSFVRRIGFPEKATH